MKKTQKILLFAILMFIIRITPVMAAKELICIYNGSGVLDFSPSIMLIQNSAGELSMKINETGNLDKNNNEWLNPSDVDVSVAFVLAADIPKGELVSCPQVAMKISISNISFGVYMFSNIKTPVLDNYVPFQMIDSYWLDKQYDEGIDEGEYSQIFNDDYLEEIKNSKWIGTCVYDRFLDEFIPIIGDDLPIIGKVENEELENMITPTERVKLYFNENKMILLRIGGKVKTAFSYNELINNYKANGKCPNLYVKRVYKYVLGAIEEYRYNEYYLTNASGSNALTLTQTDIDDYLGLYNPNLFKPQPDDVKCETLLGEVDVKGSPAYYLHVVFNVLKYVAIILLVLMTVMDMVAAVASHDDDLIKKNTSKIFKRLAFCVLIFLLPTLIEFVLQFITVGENGTIQLSTCSIGR